MQKIKYEFADGTKSEIEVSDELHSVHLEIVRQEKCNHWRETRRHTSLYYFSYGNIALRNKDGSPMINVPLYVKVSKVNKNGMTDAQESVMHRISEIMRDIENDMSFYDLSKKYGNRFIRVMKLAKEYRQAYLENKYKRQFRKMQVYYIYGSTGFSKTSYVYGKHGYDDVYRTANYEFGWIDDYNGEKVLFLDEFRSSFKISEILGYLDWQPIRIRGRQFNRVACYEIVYIVFNIPLTEQYKNIQQTEPKSWAAFLRRITAAYNFDISKKTSVNKHTGELKNKPITLIPLDDDGESPFK